MRVRARARVCVCSMTRPQGLGSCQGLSFKGYTSKTQGVRGPSPRLVAGSIIGHLFISAGAINTWALGAPEGDSRKKTDSLMG